MRYALVLAAAAGVVLAGCGDKHDEHATPDHKHDDHHAAPGDKVKDPVCGMMVAKGDLKAEFDKADFYF